MFVKGKRVIDESESKNNETGDESTNYKGKGISGNGKHRQVDETKGDTRNQEA